jgi:hypothetical protein
MRFNNNFKITIYGLLTVLNIILRIPWTPHQMGKDTFSMHQLINSVSSFGEARWWIHPASILGTYPHSYASSLPFFISGLSQIAGVEAETAILIYNFVLGSFTIYFAYIMASVIWNDDLFKFFVAFIFSTSQGIVTFSTWNANARTLFILILPVFIYVLLKSRGESKYRFATLTLLITAFLTVTHHYIYFLIPIFVTFLGLLLIYYMRHKVKKLKSLVVPGDIITLILLGLLLLMFVGSFFTRTFINTDPHPGGSRYGWLLVMATGYTRYIGLPIIFSVGGFMYLLLKKEKKFQDVFLLLTLAAIAPLLYNPTYTKWFIIAFEALFIGLGLTNLATTNTNGLLKKHLTNFMIVILIFSVIFTSYFQYIHFLNDSSKIVRHMDEREYRGGIWIKDSIDHKVATSTFLRHKIQAASEGSIFTGFGPADLAYGFYGPEDLKVRQIWGPTQINFWVKDPWVDEGSKSRTYWAVDNIVDAYWARRLISRYDISFYVQGDIRHGVDAFVERDNNNVYNNGKIRIWDVRTD